MDNKLQDNGQDTIALGEKIAEYRYRFPFSLTALLIFATAGVILLIVLGQWDAYQAGIQYGQIIAQHTLANWLWGAGAFFVITLIAFIGLIRYPRSKVTLYDWGFTLGGKKVQQFRWDEVIGLKVDYRIVWYLFFPVWQKHILLDLYDKRRIIFDGRIIKLEDLRKKISNAVFPLIQNRVKASMETKAILHFGPLLVYPESGIKMDGKAIPWERISSLEIENGHLELNYYSDSATKQKLKTKVGNVPNIPILLTTVNEILASKTD